MLVVIRRPRGPRKVRPDPETSPKPTRRPLPPGFASAKTGWPSAAVPSAHAIAGAPAVSTEITATSPSTSTPATVPGSAPVAEDDRACLVPQVVRVRQHLPLGHDDAAAEAAETDDGRTDLLCDPLDARLEFV